MEVSICEKNGALLKRYSAGDLSAEEELISENMGLVRSIARRFLDRGCEYDDLVQIGTLGMLKAIRSFSLERGTAFSTYAVPLIVGEIRRHLRDEGPIKVSRIYKRQGVLLMREKERIEREEGREVGIAELAQNCGFTPEEAAVALEAVAPITSLSESTFGEENLTVEGMLEDEESTHESEKICDRVAIAQSIGKLPAEWRKIILLRYFQNLTQQEVAKLLGLTQVKISREEKKILLYLKKELS